MTSICSFLNSSSKSIGIGYCFNEGKCSADETGTTRMAHYDRISNLSDPVLHHILSLLDSQEAVRTCVLSKRWERLWVFMESFDLSLPDFKTKHPNIERCFIRFVDSLLSKRDSSNLHAFRLFCDEVNFNVHHGSITAWILYAHMHNAKVIEIDACLYRELPPDIFTSSSLQELIMYISGLGRGVIVGGVNLPHLKKLQLCGIMSRNRAILRMLLSGCPSLEDLCLEMCCIDMSIISSPRLKHLSIFSRMDTARIESLRTPNLELLCLDLCGDALHSANFENMPFLENASIWVDGGTGFDEICNILAAFPNVRNLKLQGIIMKDLLRVELLRCHTFVNLTNLHLTDLCGCVGFNLVDGLSEQSPNLKKLQLRRSSRCDQC